MKKRCYQSVFAILLIVLSLGVTPALASTTSPCLTEVQTEDGVARAETTEWRYAIIDGVRCKRLWSTTYNCWLTDWIPC